MGDDKSKKEEEKPKKVYKERKRYPPMSDMLAYGAPEDQGKPKTFLDIVAGPAILVVLFFISFLIFVNAPIEKSNGRPTFGMNQKPMKKGQQRAPVKMEPMKVKKEPDLKPVETKPVVQEEVNSERPAKEEPAGEL